MAKFTHLHVHSQYSILDGMASISQLIEKSVSLGMYNLALTDHGNMFGIKEFAQEAEKYNKNISEKIKENEEKIVKLQEQIAALEPEAEERKNAEAEKAELEEKVAELKTQFFKPIFGCEAYVTRITESNPDGDRRLITGKKGDARGYHLILLAKNKTGYYNLCQMISKGWTEGFYGCARIDRELLEKHSEGIICASACLGGEIHKMIENNRIEDAKESARWYKNLFGDDYYLELQRHKTDKPNANTETFEKQEAQNAKLIEIARELDIKLIATNDVHFASEDDAEAHDLLICLSTNTPYTETKRLHYTKQEWLKSPEEMSEIFADYPEAIENTMEIAEKVENYKLDHAPMMPAFDIPADFGTEEEYRQKFSHEDLLAEFEATEKEKGRIEKLGGFEKIYRIKLEADYLKKLTMDGAYRRYGKDLAPEILERIEFELKVMKDMGFPGYFLIVQDFIQAARNMGVAVGPGRGSAAGSVVAYCLRITDLDPLKYDLLFERFLNPDRISLPDIDIDFDDDGRGKVLDWVTEKYGKDRVAHIITFGTMATKSSIKDVSRLMEYPLDATNYITKLIPDKFQEEKKGEKPPKVNVKNCIRLIPEIQEQYQNDEKLAKVLDFASHLEGTVRQTGVHACGVIIGADDLAKHAPLATVEDKDSKTRICVTQYEGNKVESVGLIKMDFLGLKTLSIIKETIRNVKKSKHIDVNIDTIPIDDEKTYMLYSQGRTVAVFQFESPGMQKYLKELHPTRFEDLIAMNALYRPGPMDHIPSFIARKQGKEPIVYDIPVMEKYLSDTYGITVYQEQVMLLSRLLAGFTRGESDELRKAMGKKMLAVIDRLKPKFINGGTAQGHDPEILQRIWSEWEKFASYAFNKSHAACYAWVSYQTAYLKAHYPAEFMAANMTKNLDKIDEIVKLIEDCRSMHIKVLGPDLNESDVRFTVNNKGMIRFGLAGLVGVGDSAAYSIVSEREQNGPFKDLFDFFARIDARNCNKRVIEALAKAGAFDCFTEYHRAQYFHVDETGRSTIEKLLSYSFRVQTPTSQFSIFDTMPEESNVPKPEIKECEPWNHLEMLQKEFETAKIFISGHPLSNYEKAIKEFSNFYFNELGTKDLSQFVTKPAMFGAIVKSVNTFRTKKGTEYGRISFEDLNGHGYEMALFGNDFVNYFSKFKADMPVFMKCIAKKRFNSDPNAPDVYELKPHEIIHLDDIYKMLCKEVTMIINIMDVNQDLAHKILKAVEKSKGKTMLKIRITEQNQNFFTDFLNNSFKIDVEKFIKNIDIDNLGLRYDYQLKLK